MDAEDIAAIARAVAAQMAAPSTAADLLVSELLARYVDSPEFGALRAAKTELARIAHLKAHVGHLRVSQLSFAAADDYRAARKAEPGHVRLDGRSKLTSPSTRNREIARLQRALNWAVERKLIAVNALDGAPDEEEPPPRKTRITTDDVDLLRAAALKYGRRDHRIGLTLRAMISTKYDAFLRRGELCSLRRDQVDFTAGAIVLNLDETKAHRAGTRITVLSDRAAADIRAMARIVGTSWAFPNTLGQRYNPRTFLRMLQATAVAAGVKGADGENFVGHDLRGGGITDQIEINTPEREIADMAGWTTTAMIARYHRRRGAAAVARAKERLERARGNR